MNKTYTSIAGITLFLAVLGFLVVTTGCKQQDEPAQTQNDQPTPETPSQEDSPEVVSHPDRPFTITLDDPKPTKPADTPQPSGPSEAILALQDVLQRRQFDALQEHIERCEDINESVPFEYVWVLPTSASQKASYYGTVLHQAIIVPFNAAIPLLLDHGADVNAQAAPNGSYPLTFAAAIGNQEIVALFIERGADVNAKDRRNVTALHSASVFGNMAAIRLLVENGADVNIQNNDGMVPLHMAARFNHLLAAGYLLEHGATARVYNNDRKTPLHLAVEEGNEEIAELLRAHPDK